MDTYKGGFLTHMIGQLCVGKSLDVGDQTQK